MKGAKRFVLPESNQESNDSALRNKRIMAGSPFDVHRAEPSQQQLMATPQLDVHRAESSRQHVRALNNQFASWVQTQLKNHPDELWEDGVQDYLTHASNFTDKFNDVVQWLKENASHEKNLSDTVSDAVEKKTVPEIKNNETKGIQRNSGVTPLGTTTGFGMSWASGGSSAVSSHISGAPPATNNEVKPFQGKPLFPPISTTTSSVTSWSFGSSSFAVGSSAGEKPPAINLFQGKSGFAPPASTTGSFGTSWSSGVFSNSQTPALFGNQSSTFVNRDASEDADGENDVEEPSSPSVKKSEEKGIVVVHEVKCKLYVKSIDPADKDAWKDKGSGQLSIKCQEGVSKGTKDSKPTIIIRNDVGKILLNALIYTGIKTTINKNSVVAIFHTAGDGNGDDNTTVVARTFLIRLKTEDDRNKLDAAIKEYTPAS